MFLRYEFPKLNFSPKKMREERGEKEVENRLSIIFFYSPKIIHLLDS